MFIERFPEEFELEQRMTLSAPCFRYWFEAPGTIGYVPICTASNDFLNSSIRFNDKYYVTMAKNKDGYFMMNLLRDSVYFSLDTVDEIRNSQGITVTFITSSLFYYNIVR